MANGKANKLELEHFNSKFLSYFLYGLMTNLFSFCRGRAISVVSYRARPPTLLRVYDFASITRRLFFDFGETAVSMQI